MSITIQGVPEFLTREQYLAPLAAIGFVPESILEVRYAPDGIHALVFALDDEGKKRLDQRAGRFYKHRVFIPVLKDDTDERTTRVTTIKN